jgi:hypothetical protein
MAEIKIIFVDNITPPNKKLASFQWNFSLSSISREELHQLHKLGVETYLETECIDERALSRTILTGKVRLERNYPGGGFDFLTKEQIESIIKYGGNLIVLDPHRECGWGKMRWDFYLDYKDPIIKPIPNTTMHMERDEKFKNGIEYIHKLVMDAFSENNFINGVFRSYKLYNLFTCSKDFDVFLKEAFPKPHIFVEQEGIKQELLELAFAYGKQRELKYFMEEEAEIYDNYDFRVKLNPDMLFEQPENHIADDVVINLGQRILLRRFPINSTYPDSFFVDANMENLDDILKLVITIMEGKHSKSSKRTHEIHLVCTSKQIVHLKKILSKYDKKSAKLHTDKTFYIHQIENEENPRSDRDLLDLVM